jgi:hypothetical protein
MEPKPVNRLNLETVSAVHANGTKKFLKRGKLL